MVAIAAIGLVASAAYLGRHIVQALRPSPDVHGEGWELVDHA